MCELLVGLPDITVLGAFRHPDQRVELHIQTLAETMGCPTCGVVATFKGWREVTFSDLPSFGSPVSLHWHKRRWLCAQEACPQSSWTEVDDRIAGPRLRLTDRAARCATFEVGANGRTVAEVAAGLGCDWHTVNDAVVTFGEALVDHPGRFGAVASLGLDEHLFAKLGERRRRHFVTAIVDVEAGQLLDLVPDRRAEAPIAWLRDRGETWLAGVTSGTLDLSATYKSVFDTVLPGAELVADPFHVVRHANDQVDLARRRVQNEIFGHRGRKSDPLYRARRLLTMAAERLDENGREKLLGLVRAGDRYGQVESTWSAKEALRELYTVVGGVESQASVGEFLHRRGHGPRRDFQGLAPGVKVRAFA